MLLHIETFATTLKDMAAFSLDDFIREVKFWDGIKFILDFVPPIKCIPVGDAVHQFIYSVIYQLYVEKLDPVFVSTTYTVTLCNILIYFIIYGDASFDVRTYRKDMMIEIFDVVGTSLPGTLPTFRSRLIGHLKDEALAQADTPTFVVPSVETP